MVHRWKSSQTSFAQRQDVWQMTKWLKILDIKTEWQECALSGFLSGFIRQPGKKETTKDTGSGYRPAPPPGGSKKTGDGQEPPVQGSALFSVQSGGPPPGVWKRETLALKSTAQSPVLSGLALWRKTTVVSIAYGTHCRPTGNCVHLRRL